MYSHNNVLKNAIQYFNGDELAATVWMNKYCLKNNNGDFLEKSPEDMHKRLAKEFARIEKKYPNPMSEEKIFELINRFDYIVPQGSPMSGIGNNHKIQSISNCFVIKNPYDSYAGIFKTEQEMVQLMKRRGGVGFSIHSLRPKEMPTSSVSEKSSGIVLFSERFSNGTREVAQDGRRGALMLSCRVDHPDIESFIDAKLDLKKITGANVSIMITDAFMEAVKVDGEYELTFIGEKGSISKKIKAKKVWDKIMFNAHKSAEPGILFMDTIHNESPVKNYGEEWVETSTNPCVTGDTIVKTLNGDLTIKEIFDNKILADIYSYNTETEKIEVDKIENVYLTRKNANVIELELDNGESIKLTPDHKVYTKNRGWTPAGVLTTEDILLKIE